MTPRCHWGVRNRRGASITSNVSGMQRAECTEERLIYNPKNMVFFFTELFPALPQACGK